LHLAVAERHMNFRQHMHTKASFLLPTLSKIRIAELLQQILTQYLTALKTIFFISKINGEGGI
ncbi:hypothetical protein, partial [Muricomes intestini]|uniref:hypothetical protein n=1 Tax=Muricomes intestini TaxID=1796634 RepID=UPI001A9B4D16